MTESEVIEKTRAFVMETFLYMRPQAGPDDDTALLQGGIIDSLGVMELVGFVEQHFGVTVAPDDITEQHFGSLRGIARYVLGKQGA